MDEYTPLGDTRYVFRISKYTILMKCMIYTLGQREGQTNGNKMNNLGRETKKILGRAFSITDHFPSAHSSLT